MFRESCVPGNARARGSGEASAIWSLRHCKPAACILGLIGANVRLTLVYTGFPHLVIWAMPMPRPRQRHVPFIMPMACPQHTNVIIIMIIIIIIITIQIITNIMITILSRMCIIPVWDLRNEQLANLIADLCIDVNITTRSETELANTVMLFICLNVEMQNPQLGGGWSHVRRVRQRFHRGVWQRSATDACLAFGWKRVRVFGKLLRSTAWRRRAAPWMLYYNVIYEYIMLGWMML